MLKERSLMVQLQKVGRSGTEPADDYTFGYAGINEKDHMGGPCSKHGRGKKKLHRIFVRNLERNGLLEIIIIIIIMSTWK